MRKPQLFEIDLSRYSKLNYTITSILHNSSPSIIKSKMEEVLIDNNEWEDGPTFSSDNIDYIKDTLNFINNIEDIKSPDISDSVLEITSLLANLDSELKYIEVDENSNEISYSSDKSKTIVDDIFKVLLESQFLAFPANSTEIEVATTIDKLKRDILEELEEFMVTSDDEDEELKESMDTPDEEDEDDDELRYPFKKSDNILYENLVNEASTIIGASDISMMVYSDLTKAHRQNHIRGMINNAFSGKLVDDEYIEFDEPIELMEFIKIIQNINNEHIKKLVSETTKNIFKSKVLQKLETLNYKTKYISFFDRNEDTDEIFEQIPIENQELIYENDDFKITTQVIEPMVEQYKQFDIDKYENAVKKLKSVIENIVNKLPQNMLNINEIKILDGIKHNISIIGTKIKNQEDGIPGHISEPCRGLETNILIVRILDESHS